MSPRTTRITLTVGMFAGLLLASVATDVATSASLSTAAAADCGSHYGEAMPGSEGTQCPPELTPAPTPTPTQPPAPKPTPTPSPTQPPAPNPEPTQPPAPNPEPTQPPAPDPTPVDPPVIVQDPVPAPEPVSQPVQPASAPAPAPAPVAEVVAVAPVAPVEVTTADATERVVADAQECLPGISASTVWFAALLAALVGLLIGLVGGLRSFMRTGHKWAPQVRRVLAGPLHHHRLDETVEPTSTDGEVDPETDEVSEQGTDPQSVTSETDETEPAHAG